MKKLMMFMGAMLLALNASAQTTLKIEDFSISAGESKTITLDLDNPDVEAAAFQCDVYLPEGIEFQKNSRGKIALKFNTTTERTDASYHTLTSALQDDGALRIVCYSASADVFLGTSGALIDIPIVASETIATGKGELKVAAQEITDAVGKQTKPADYVGVVSIITGIKNVSADGAETSDGKYLENGQVIIKKAGKEYTTSGAQKK